MTRIFISTGEVSGDLQGALLVTALRRRAEQVGQSLELLALGGDRMAAAGATLLGNTSAIGSVGLLETLPFVLPTLQIQKRAKTYLQTHPPDLVVLIDYFGANVGLGRYMRRHFPKVPVVYYIAPQEWVWSLSPKNTQQIVDISDRLLAIFPQEASYYEKHGAAVTWIGHPLIDRVLAAPTREQARQALGIAPNEPAIALLPASRRQEIKYLLPIIFAAAQKIQTQQPQAHFWIPLSLETYRPAIEAAIAQYGLKATIVTEQPERAIAAADLAIAKSGTANLEIALMNVPQIALYCVHPVTAWIARKILKFDIPFMSPPNLVLMEAIVPEFLQEQATPDRLAQSALHLLQPEPRQQMLNHYERMRLALGEPGVADRAAVEIFRLLP